MLTASNASRALLWNVEQHGSFPNRSTARRTTIIFGFHPKFAVDGVYTPEEIALRSRVIPLAIDARRQKWRREEPYAYRPLAEERWQGQTEAKHKILTAQGL